MRTAPAEKGSKKGKRFVNKNDEIHKDKCLELGGNYFSPLRPLSMYVSAEMWYKSCTRPLINPVTILINERCPNHDRFYSLLSLLW